MNQEGAAANLIINMSLVDIIVQKIRDNILNGVYKPGQKLIVRDIEEEMRVSQTPIKAALHKLVAEGYVESLPRKSMIVRRVTYEEYEWNMEMRLALELFIVPEIVGYEDETFIRGMEDDMRNLKKTLNGKIDYRRWLEYDFSFHKRYVNIHPNGRLSATYSGLQANRSSYFAFLDTEKHPPTENRLMKDYEEHERILAAIKARNVAELAGAIVTHITRPRVPGKASSDVQARVARVCGMYMPAGEIGNDCDG